MIRTTQAQEQQKLIRKAGLTEDVKALEDWKMQSLAKYKQCSVCAVLNRKKLQPD